MVLDQSTKSVGFVTENIMVRKARQDGFEKFLSIRDFTSQTLASFLSDLVGVALVGATPLHLLSQTALPLKSPTGAFSCAAQTRSHPKPCSWFAPDGANSNGVSCLHNFTEELSNRQEVQ